MRSAQSKILTLLSFVQLGKFFSHYGIRTLLVLYMIEHLRYFDAKAFGVNAVFCGLVELGGIFGGIIADRYLGLRRAMVIGGVLLSVGYSCLILEQGFLLSMGVIILGSSLFSGNILALLGLAYTENDSKRTQGFALFYMCQNLGALVSIGLCGLLASCYGFRLAFAVASVGMVISNLVLFLYRDLLGDLGEIPKQDRKPLYAMGLSLLLLALGGVCVYVEGTILLFLPWITGGFLLFFARVLLKDLRNSKKQVMKFLVYLGALILFFGVEDQICSSLLLFAERQTDRIVFGWMIPSSFITGINPVIILLFGSLVVKKQFSLMTPFVLTASAFALLSCFCLAHLSFSIFGVMGIVALISVAELMIGPIVFSYASEMSAKGNAGMVMGMVPIAFSLAFQLSGECSKMMAVEDVHLSLNTYGSGFGLVSMLLLFGGIVLQIAMRRYSCGRFGLKLR